MWKSLGLVAIGALFGAAILIALQRDTSETANAIRQPIIVDARPVLSDAEVASARDSHFAGIGGIEDVLALPTDFSRREALYVLAGRSDAESLQKLIFDGDRIADRTVRVSVLTILFRRLAEVDPQTALALARVDPYRNDDSFERVIWRTWARNDLDVAIAAVKAETPGAYQQAAAQSLYAAYGYMGNDATERIAKELGIEPDRQTRLRFLRTLLEDSPRRVIEYIGKEPSDLRRREYISWLAYALDARDRNSALSHAESFVSASDQALYSQLVKDRFSRLDPVDTVRQALANNDTGPNSDFHGALQELASTDMTAAMDFYAQMDASQAKMMAAFVIASELVNSDPAAALDWIRAQEGVSNHQVEAILLGRIAETDPEFALAAAAELPGSQRTASMSSILAAVTRTQPALAATLLASLPDDSDQSRIRKQVGQAWLMNDPAAAIEWLGTLDESEASSIAADAAGVMARIHPEMTDELLDLLDERQRVRSVTNLVSQFGSVGDVARARALIDKFGRKDGFVGLEASLVQGLVRHDSQAATQLALQIQDEKERSDAFTRIAGSIAADHPSRAVSLLTNITEPADRERALQAIAGQWYRSDPDAALRWVSSLSAGAERDAAALRIAMSSDDVGRRELDLINSMSDPRTRTRAQQLAVVRLARKDHAAATRILEEMDIPADDKTRLRDRIQDISPTQ